MEIIKGKVKGVEYIPCGKCGKEMAPEFSETVGDFFKCPTCGNLN